MSSLKGIVNC